MTTRTRTCYVLFCCTASILVLLSRTFPFGVLVCCSSAINMGKINLLVRTNKRWGLEQTPGPRLNAPSVYLKTSRFDRTFMRGRHLIEVRRLIEKIRYFETQHATCKNKIPLLSGTSKTRTLSTIVIFL